MEHINSRQQGKKWWIIKPKWQSQDSSTPIRQTPFYFLWWTYVRQRRYGGYSWLKKEEILEDNELRSRLSKKAILDTRRSKIILQEKIPIFVCVIFNQMMGAGVVVPDRRRGLLALMLGLAFLALPTTIICRRLGRATAARDPSGSWALCSCRIAPECGRGCRSQCAGSWKSFSGSTLNVREDCGFLTRDHEEIKRHINYHSYHAKLKNNGAQCVDQRGL